jgi:hypothetical protein
MRTTATMSAIDKLIIMYHRVMMMMCCHPHQRLSIFDFFDEGKENKLCAFMDMYEVSSLQIVVGPKINVLLLRLTLRLAVIPMLMIVMANPAKKKTIMSTMMMLMMATTIKRPSIWMMMMMMLLLKMMILHCIAVTSKVSKMKVYDDDDDFVCGCNAVESDQSENWGDWETATSTEP